MQVEYKSYLLTRFCPDNANRWELCAPFVFSVDGVEFVVPKGFWTDFASVPRVFHLVLNPYELGCGPVPHDFGYFTGMCNREFWDEVFLSCMELDGISWWRRRAAYSAVRAFGGLVFRRYRKENDKYALHLADGRYHIDGWERDAVA